MDDRYAAFTMADPAFYDAMYSAETAGESFDAAGRELPEGWRRSESDDWLTMRRDDTSLPGQGWKIHASATMDGAERVLAAVWDCSCGPSRPAGTASRRSPVSSRRSRRG
jgi:hypothetical protein